MPAPRAADLRAGQGVLRRRGVGDAGVARRMPCAPRSTSSKEKDVVSAGFVETSAQIQAVATSKGLFGYDRFTAADYNLTARTPDGTGSGWASKSFSELRLLRSADACGRRDRQGGAVAEPDGHRARQVHRRARAGRDGRSARLRWRLPPTRVRPTKGAASSRRKAAARALASRSSARRCASIPIRLATAGAGRAVRRPGAAAEADRLGRRGRAEEPVVLALLGAEAGQGGDCRSPAT